MTTMAQKDSDQETKQLKKVPIDSKEMKNNRGHKTKGPKLIQRFVRLPQKTQSNCINT